MTAVLQRPPTAQEAVLTEVRSLIATGRMRPGEQIVQEALALQLGVSRVPSREALKILEGEGQVSYLAHRGYFVALLSLADLLEVYRMRAILEAEAVDRDPAARLVRVGQVGAHALPVALAEYSVEPELQDLHPGQPEPGPQLLYLRRDHAQVLGHQGTLDPPAVAGEVSPAGSR